MNKKVNFEEVIKCYRSEAHLCNDEYVLINDCEVQLNKKVQIYRKHLSATDLELN